MLIPALKPLVTKHISFVNKTHLCKAQITTSRSLVTGGFGKQSENMGFFGTKPRLRPFSAFIQRVPKPDIHSMEGIELYLGR